jgi:hypothetical protein
MVLILCFSTSAMAQNVNKTCIDDNTLQINTTYDVLVDGGTTSIVVSQTQYCPGGCSLAIDDCLPTSAQISSGGIQIPFYILFEVISLIIFFTSFSNLLKLEKEGRIVMSVLSLVLFAFLIFESFRIVVSPGNTVYNISLAVLNVLFFAITLLSTIGILFMRLGAAGGEPSG